MNPEVNRSSGWNDADSGVSRGNNLIEGLGTSWIFTGIKPEHTARLLASDGFMRYAGLAALPVDLRSDSAMSFEAMRLYVAGNFAANDLAYNLPTWERYKADLLTTHPFYLFPEEEYAGADLKLNTYLLVDLLIHLGHGYTIETLGQHFIRPRWWRLPDNIPEDVLELYLKSKRGRFYKPTDQKWARWNNEREWIDEIHKVWGEEDDDIKTVITDIREGRQPYVSIKSNLDVNTLVAKAHWGVRLATLEVQEIRKLTEHGFLCHPSCQYYHGYSDKLKALGELIAPVDAELFGEKLYARYREWQNNKSEGKKFKVLIPAQADEKTMEGILTYLMTHGVSHKEIGENFYFVLADLCATPLLKVYAHLKDLQLLEIANIVSMDVFNWGDEKEEKFDFIAADHLIDLFPPEGNYNQIAVLRSLVNALVPDGELVLTARCGTVLPITSEGVMKDFYRRVDKQIEKLLNNLEVRGREGILRLSVNRLIPAKTDDMFITSQNVARAIYALLVYRQLRQVHPFSTIGSLERLLGSLQQEMGITYDIETFPRKSDKVNIVITRSITNL